MEHNDRLSQNEGDGKTYRYTVGEKPKMDLNITATIAKWHKYFIWVAILLGSYAVLNFTPIESWIANVISNATQPSSSNATLTGTNQIVAEESLVIEVVEKTNASVVSIGQHAQSFSRFSGMTTQDQGIGTGFIVSSDGYIVTNKHVVSDPSATYYVLDSSGKTYEIEQVYHSEKYDLALVKINASNLTPLELADSSTVQVGQYVIAIGNALGEFNNTVTTGIVSGTGRAITAGDGNPFSRYQEQMTDLIQTDAAINQGNSGGPLLNSSGQVIGINTAVSSDAQNIGFAQTSNVIKEFIQPYLQ